MKEKSWIPWLFYILGISNIIGLPIFSFFGLATIPNLFLTVLIRGGGIF